MAARLHANMAEEILPAFSAIIAWFQPFVAIGILVLAFLPSFKFMFRTFATSSTAVYFGFRCSTFLILPHLDAIVGRNLVAAPIPF